MVQEKHIISTSAFEWTESLITIFHNRMTRHSDSLLLCTLSIVVRNKDAALESIHFLLLFILSALFN